MINAARHQGAAYARPTQRTESVQQTAEGCETAALSIAPPPPTPSGANFYRGRGGGGKCSRLNLLSSQTLERKRNSRHFPLVIKISLSARQESRNLKNKGSSIKDLWQKGFAKKSNGWEMERTPHSSSITQSSHSKNALVGTFASRTFATL